MGIANALWSVSTLKAEILGELNQDRNDAGTAPDRITNLCVEALRELWTMADWAFTLRSGTLSPIAGDQSEALAGDFREMHSYVLHDPDNEDTLTITRDRRKWQDYRGSIDTTVRGFPTLGVLNWDPVNSVWAVYFDRPCADGYAFAYEYAAECPLDLPTGHANLKGVSDVIPMPPTFHVGWHILALLKCQKEFRRDDVWQSTWRHFKSWLETQKAERDDPTTQDNEPIQEGYGDWGATLHNATLSDYGGADPGMLPGID
ncbi:MAG: hypothetical protein PHU85_00560 [Phycisphaerae bacterium]|nr:hypothetical protein [Phycisphaerae bacterium]